MRASQFHAPTLRRAPSEVLAPGQQLLVRGGFLRVGGDGAATLLPLGTRLLSRLRACLQVFLDRLGAQEIVCLTAGAGNPRPAVMLGRDLTSYKQLPRLFYHLTSRDATVASPRGGLLTSAAVPVLEVFCLAPCAETARQHMATVGRELARLLEELGAPLRVTAVPPGTEGPLPGLAALFPAGPEAFLHCAECGYLAPQGMACSRSEDLAGGEAEPMPLARVSTPGARTVEAVCTQLGVQPTQLAKTLLYRAGDVYVAALMRGDRQVSASKLGDALGGVVPRMARPEEIRELTGGPVGFSGPLGLPASCRLIADEELRFAMNMVVGGNAADCHLVGACVGRDFSPETFADLRQAKEGEKCIACSGALQSAAGVALASGWVWEALAGTACADETGAQRALSAAVCTVDLTRCLAVVAECQNDDKGVHWPVPLAPFEVAVLLLDPTVPELRAAAETVYETLCAAGRETLLDDRDERPGAKFKDADLVGYPVVVVVGKRLPNEGLLEVRRRCPEAEALCAPQQVLPTVVAMLTDSS